MSRSDSKKAERAYSTPTLPLTVAREPGQLCGAIWELWQVNGDRRIGDKGQNLKCLHQQGGSCFSLSIPSLVFRYLKPREGHRWSKESCRKRERVKKVILVLSLPVLRSVLWQQELTDTWISKRVGEPCCFVFFISCSLVPDMGMVTGND